MKRNLLIVAAMSIGILGCEPDARNATSLYEISDATQFANVMQAHEAMPSAEKLQFEYIGTGTYGLNLMLRDRIKSAQNLADKISAAPEVYAHALKTCLPVVERIQEEAVDTLKRTATFLAQSDPAPIYVVFGANNSGGMAGPQGVVLGLEVICRFAPDAETAEELLRTFVAHEIVHVYQIRNVSDEMMSTPPTLLSQSIVEGFAEWTAEQVLGRRTAMEEERFQYLKEHEVALWQEFSQQLDSNSFAPWMYQVEGLDRPADLGYSIGREIVDGFINNAPDREAAIAELLSFKDPHDILRRSGYVERITRAAK